MDTFHAAILLNTIFWQFKCQTVSKELAIELNQIALKDGWKLCVVYCSTKDDLYLKHL